MQEKKGIFFFFPDKFCFGAFLIQEQVALFLFFVFIITVHSVTF